MSIAKLMFSFEGRIGRAAFWVAIIIYSIASRIVFSSAISAKGASWASLGVVGIILLVLSWPAYAVMAKRFHDLDLSGWWGLVTLCPLVAIFAFAFGMGFGTNSMPSASVVMMVLSALCLIGTVWGIWLSIKLYFFPGNSGPNRFGLPPAPPLKSLFASDVSEMEQSGGMLFAPAAVDGSEPAIPATTRRSVTVLQRRRVGGGGPAAFGKRQH